MENRILKSVFNLIVMIGIVGITTVQAQITGNGNVQSQTRNVSGFTGIRSSSSVDIFINQGTGESVRVVADENLLELITTRVENGVLVIDFSKSVWNSKTMEVYVTVKNLNLLELNGSGNAKIREALTGNDLQIEMRGSGDLNASLDIRNIDLQIMGSGDVDFSGVRGNLTISVMGSGDVAGSNLQLENAFVKVMGSGDVSLSGSVVNLRLEQSGSGDNNFYNLKAVNAIINISGSGDVVVNAIEKLSVKSGGSGDVTYTGSPKMVDVDASGSGEIYKK